MSYTDVCLQLKRIGSIRAYAEANQLEIDTYGETKRPAKHTLNVGTYQPRGDYVTLRNVEVSLIAELRRFGRLLRGYPMKPREFYRQAELRRPLNEKPTCPIHGTDRYVHWIGRNHWTCTANHLPQHFGMLRLT